MLPALAIPIDPEPIRGLNLQFLLYCVFVVGLVEEVFKFLPFLIIMRFSDFDDELDGIFYASACALGFASYENVHYLPGLAGFALLGRAFASPLSHSVFASVWGHLIGRRPVFLIKTIVQSPPSRCQTAASHSEGLTRERLSRITTGACLGPGVRCIFFYNAPQKINFIPYP
ncbi:MAG: PrsW family intramembrane metalloprotease [Candidatus Aminicenantes bacterium]|nr:PrsW family intramembrane metalloprotease [Candidatus Aminicenantes bacterium]